MTVSPRCFKAYDIRGLYPEELDAEGARRIGAALAAQLGARTGRRAATPAVVARGWPLPSPSAPPSPGAQARLRHGPHRDVVLRGGHRGLDGGAVVTASHNPPNTTA